MENEDRYRRIEAWEKVREWLDSPHECVRAAAKKLAKELVDPN